MNEVYDFLKKAGTYFLATVEGDQARVRPFGTIDLFEGRLYIQTAKSKSVAEQLKKSPKVELSAMLDGKWIRVAATAVLDDNIAAQAHMLDEYPSLKDRYKAGDGNTEVYYLKDATATISSFTDEPKVINF